MKNKESSIITRGTHSLHITLGTSSSSLNLYQDIRLLKAAILYGDHVELYSLTASILTKLMELKNISLPLQISLLEATAPYIQTEEQFAVFSDALQGYKLLMSYKGSGSRQISIEKQKFRKGMQYGWASMRKMIEAIAKEAGLEHLNSAIKAGILDIHSFEGINNQQKTIDYMADSIALASKSSRLDERRPQITDRQNIMLGEFVQNISSAVSSGATLPLFDEGTGALIKKRVNDGLILPTISAVNRGKHSALAAHLLGRLPLFESASLDEVIAIRGELNRPLIRFRGALLNFSESIKSASWDDDFSSDADTVFLKDVAPAILDIEDAIKSNNLVASIVRKIGGMPFPSIRPATMAGTMAGIGLAMSNFSTLPNAMVLSLGVGVAVDTSFVVYDAYKEWQEKNLKVEQNTMYFYYQAAKKMD